MQHCTAALKKVDSSDFYATQSNSEPPLKNHRLWPDWVDLNHFTVKWSLIKVEISVIGGRKKAEIRFQSRFHSRNHHSSNLYLTQVYNSLQFLKEWNVCKLWNLRNLFTLKKDTRNLPASLCDERGRGRITQWTINFLPNLSFSNFPGTILKFYRLRSTTAFVFRPTIIRSKVIASTLLGSTIFKSTQNYNNQNCFYTNNVYRTYAYRYLHTQEMGLQD